MHERVHHDACHPGDDLAVELRGPERAADLRLVNDALGVLASDELPVGRRFGGREETHRLAGDGLEADRLVEGLRPLAGEGKELDELRDAQELGRGHPLLVERVEHGPELDPGMLRGVERDAVGRRVALAREQRQVVAQNVERDALDRPGRALGGAFPLFGRQTPQQLEQRGSFGCERRDRVDHGRAR